MIRGIRISHTKHLRLNLVRLNRISQESIVVMNIGLHYNDEHSYRGFLKELEQLCFKKMCTKATIVWQETAAQHFPGTKDGYFSGPSKCKSGCARIPREEMRKTDFRNKFANQVMTQNRIPILHVWDLTQDAHDMHIQYNTRSGLCDCTHFCNVQMGVFTAYNRVLQAWLVQKFA